MMDNCNLFIAIQFIYGTFARLLLNFLSFQMTIDNNILRFDNKWKKKCRISCSVESD